MVEAQGLDKKAHATTEKERELESALPSNFHWKDVEPVKLRPLKSTYYITMGSAPHLPHDKLL